jgi:hypothetical protein
MPPAQIRQHNETTDESDPEKYREHITAARIDPAKQQARNS